MNENKIIISNLNKFYGKKQVLFDLNLTINGGMFGLLGRNGAGKTTLMKILATLLNKKSGEINICGVPVENAKEIRKIIGYLPQEFSMYPNMTAAEAMDYLGVLSGMSQNLRRERIPDLLNKVNLFENRKVKVKALSGGMKRRLGIAQALLHDPKVLIADEPTAGLDPEERIRFRNLFCEAAEDKTVILSTHIASDIEASCENISILNEGRMLYNGTVSKLLKAAEGKVYTVKAAGNDLAAIKNKYIVTGMIAAGETSSIRIVSEHEPELKADLCDPNVEDAYMLCLHRNRADKHIPGGEQP